MSHNRLGTLLAVSILIGAVAVSALRARTKPLPPAAPVSASIAAPVPASVSAPAAVPVPADQAGPTVQSTQVPPYHDALPKADLPATLPPANFSDPRVQNAYAMAAKIRPVLYQQPCYCGCDKEVGHQSLLDCFAGDHASICQTCMMEGVYAYQQTQAGKTPQQIRAAIVSGSWKTINMNNFLTPRHY